jgi:hypothetical protein
MRYSTGDQIVFQGPGGPRVLGVVLAVRELTMGGPVGHAIEWRDLGEGHTCTHDINDTRISAA